MPIKREKKKMGEKTAVYTFFRIFAATITLYGFK